MTNHTLQLADRVRGLTAPTTFGRVLGVPPEGSVALTSGSPDVGSCLPTRSLTPRRP